MTEAVAIDLPLEPGSAKRARSQVERFRGLLYETSFSDLRLLVSELVSEALSARPASTTGRIRLRTELCDDRVRVSVAQGGDGYRLPSRRPLPGQTGWSLYLVQRLSNRWGMQRDRESATVWLEQFLAPAGR
jgi:hypothetical protein